MSKYAIVQISGRQVKVSEGDQLTLDRLDQLEGKEFQIKEVLMIGDAKTQQIGTPILDKAAVTFKLIEHGRSKKLRVAKFRAKSKYRRVYGHRQPQSTIEVVKITG